MNKQLFYGWNDFEEDIGRFENYFIELSNYENNKKEYYFVGVHRGGMPLAVTLSNKFETECGIVKYQSYGKDSSKVFSIPLFDLEYAKNRTVVIVDDICDTGRTFEIIDQELRALGIKDLMYISLFMKDDIGLSNLEIISTRIKTNEWIVFPWE